MSFPLALERVGHGFELPGLGRVRDLLDADDDVHGAASSHAPDGPSPTGPSRALDRSGSTCSARCWSGRHEGAAAGELVGVVGDGPQPGRDPEGAVGRPRGDAGRDQPARPRHPPGPGRGGRRHRRGRRARRRRHAERGGQRAGRPTPRWPRCPAAPPTCSPARIGLPERPDRGHRRRCSTRSAATAIRRVGLGSVNGRYFLFHVGMGFDAAVVAQVERRAGAEALRRPPAVRLRRRSTPGSATTTAAGPGSRCASPTATVVDDGYFAICLNTNPYTYLGQPAAQRRARGHPRPRPRHGDGAHARLRHDDAHHRLGARQRASTCAPRAGPTTAPTSPG